MSRNTNIKTESIKLPWLTALFFFLGPASIFAQEIKLSSNFMADSIMIGDETPYYLTARYPSSLTILFPDSSYNYSPFEFQRKVYFATQSTGGISYDSVVYYLSTFEIDSIQSLSLPVFIVNPADCTVFVSDADSLLLNELIRHYVDSLDARSLPLRINAAYEPVGNTFNYPLAIAIAFGLVLIVAILWFLFGGKIKRHWLIKRLQKKYTRFAVDYSIVLQKLGADFNPGSAEAAVIIWKKYLEDLERIPLTKLTTREAIGILKETSLEKSLRTIDRVIYGNSTATIEPFNHLRTFADRTFQKKLEELKNG